MSEESRRRKLVEFMRSIEDSARKGELKGELLGERYPFGNIRLEVRLREAASRRGMTVEGLRMALRAMSNEVLTVMRTEELWELAQLVKEDDERCRPKSWDDTYRAGRREGEMDEDTLRRFEERNEEIRTTLKRMGAIAAHKLQEREMLDLLEGMSEKELRAWLKESGHSFDEMAARGREVVERALGSVAGAGEGKDRASFTVPSGVTLRVVDLPRAAFLVFRFPTGVGRGAIEDFGKYMSKLFPSGGRIGFVIFVGEDPTLEVLTDEQLRQVGLQRIERPGEKRGTEEDATGSAAAGAVDAGAGGAVRGEGEACALEGGADRADDAAGDVGSGGVSERGGGDEGA